MTRIDEETCFRVKLEVFGSAKESKTNNYNILNTYNTV